MTKSISSITAALVLISSAWGGPGLAAPASTGAAAHCESKTPDFDGRVTCTFPASGAGQHFAFRARFTGSHDDTTLSMTAALNQQPLTCEPGSKTSSRFEDGEITLECRFSVSAKAGTKQTLEMNVVWSHAQYADFEFTAL